MKKSIYLFLIVILILSLAFQVSLADKKIVSGETVELKLAHSQATTHHYHLTAVKFAELVKEKSNGKIIIKIFPHAMLGSGKSQVEAVRLGKIDFTIQYTGYMSQFIPDTEIFGMEYAFDTWDQYYKFCNSSYAKEWFKDVEKSGLKVLGIVPNGKYYLISTKPIHSLADLKGMKMRGKPGTKQSILFDKIHGTATTPVSYKELYSSLQLNLVNVVSQNVSNIKNESFYEVAPYVYELPIMFAVNPIYMSVKTFESLPEDYQKIILNAGSEACQWMQKKYREIEKQDYNWLVEKGVKFYKPTEAEKNDWLSKTSAISDLYKTSYSEKAPEIVDYILEITGKK